MAIHADSEKETKRGDFGYSDMFLFKFMFSYMMPYKRELAVTLIFMVIFSITTALGPIILLNSIDYLQGLHESFTMFGVPFLDHYIAQMITAIESGNYFPGISRFWLDICSYVFIYFVVGFLGFYVAYKSNMIVGYIGLSATKKIREDLFSHLQELDMSYHDKNEVGRIMSRATSDVEAIRQFFGGSIIENLMNFLTVAVVGIVIWFIDPFLAVITYLLMPIIIVLSSFQKKYGRPLHKESRRTNSILMAYLGESIQGIKVTKGMNREQKSEELFGELNHNKRNADIEARFMNIRFFSSMLFIQSLSIALIILFGGLRLIEGNIVSVAVILAFLNYNIILFRPVIILGNFYEQLQNALTGSERIYALLSTPTKVPYNNQLPSMTDIQGNVTFDNIYFEYIPNKPVYKKFNLSVPAGSTVALVGHTGAGKTTVVNILSRMYEYQGGKLLIDGTEIKSVSTPSFKSQIAVVPQDFFLFSTSIRDNLKLGKPDATDEEIWNVLDLVNLRKFITRLPLQLDEPVQERGARLSIGQRQLIIFAAILLADPRIVVLDEATSSVDIFSEILIQKALNLVLKDRTSFIVAHRLSTIRDADMIVVIDEGEIIETGKHDELYAKKGFYWELVKHQVELSEID